MGTQQYPQTFCSLHPANNIFLTPNQNQSAVFFSHNEVFFFWLCMSISVVAVQMSDTFHCVYVDMMNERAEGK